MNTVMIEEMSWSKFREAMSSSDLVIIPVGSTESHGPHNPLGTDSYISRSLAKAIGERVNAPVAPVMPLGATRNLMRFPGTATVDTETLRQVYVQICESFIRHGARRFLFVNGHGGNVAALRFATTDLYEKYGVISTNTEWWTTLAQMSGLNVAEHGGKHETSLVMAVDSRLVDMSKAKTLPRSAPTDGFTVDKGVKFRGGVVTLPIPVDKFTPLGSYGAAVEEASKEIGDRLFDQYVDFCVGLAEEMRKIIVQDRP